MSGGLLLVGAHVGDMDFTAGHLARLHVKAGDEVLLLHLTAGEAGHPDMDRAAYKVQKLGEATAAAGALGAEHRVMMYPDGDLVASQEVAAAVASVIEQARPRVLVTHWRGSFHRDHANCYFAVERALGMVTSPLPEVFYAENWEDADGFRADSVIDIGDVYQEWVNAARCHELFRGGVVTFDYQGYYEALTATRGRMAGVERAAAFMRPPPVLSSPLARLGSPGPLATGGSGG
jgi:N-acetylglucosamine malate deacetylase 1